MSSNGTILAHRGMVDIAVEVDGTHVRVRSATMDAISSTALAMRLTVEAELTPHESPLVVRARQLRAMGWTLDRIIENEKN